MYTTIKVITASINIARKRISELTTIKQMPRIMNQSVRVRLITLLNKS